MIELPDPASVIPDDWMTRSLEEKREIYAKQPEWEQLLLPLAEFEPQIRCASGWCAPSEPEYALVEVGS